MCHGRATRGGFGAAASPDVEEDGRTCVWGGLGRRIVSDEELERMSLVILLHLLGFFPCGVGIVRDDEVAVIVWGL